MQNPVATRPDDDPPERRIFQFVGVVDQRDLLIIAKGGMELLLDDLEDTFKSAIRPRITRIYSKAIDPTARRRNIAG